MNNKIRRGIQLVFIIGGLVGAVAGGYFLFAKFLHDRQSAMSYRDTRAEIINRRMSRTQNNQVQTYTAEEIEEARKTGKLPRTTTQGSQQTPPPVNNGNEAIQRNLRAIEEINRINQMNQRLMEQQDRMNRQK